MAVYLLFFFFNFTPLSNHSPVDSRWNAFLSNSNRRRRNEFPGVTRRSFNTGCTSPISFPHLLSAPPPFEAQGQHEMTSLPLRQRKSICILTRQTGAQKTGCRKSARDFGLQNDSGRNDDSRLLDLQFFPRRRLYSKILNRAS